MRNGFTSQQIKQGDFDITALSSIISNCSCFADDNHWIELAAVLRAIRNKTAHSQKQRIMSEEAIVYIEKLEKAIMSIKIYKKVC